MSRPEPVRIYLDDTLVREVAADAAAYSRTLPETSQLLASDVGLDG